MWDLEVFAYERFRSFQHEAQQARRMYNAVHGDGNGAESRGGWRNRRQRLGHSITRAGAVIAGNPDQAAR